MYPARTTYHAAIVGADFRAIHAFFKAEADTPQAKDEGLGVYEKFRIGQPTVYALRDGAMCGVMATQLHPKYGPIAAPLHVAYHLKNHVPTAIRLIDTYEAILRGLGISGYLCPVPSWKPSAVRVFGDIKHAEIIGTIPQYRLLIYNV